MKEVRILPKLISSILLLAGFWSCQPSTDYKSKVAQADFLHRSMKQLTDVIVHDIFSPPVASRNYAYPSIAAYEALLHDFPAYQSLVGQLHELDALPQPDPEKEYCFPLASVTAFLTTAKHFIFSVDKMEAFEADMYQEFKEMGVPKAVYNRSMEYGKTVAEHIISWSDGDNYKQTRTFPKFTVTEDEGRWQPTPPGYMEGIEPHWNKIRPFVIDSATQFVPIPPTPYDMDKNSTFYQELMEVYDVGQKLDEEQEEIAQFWDCNPYVSHHRGHVMFATKKITPGGHWVGIVYIACKETGADMMQTAEAYARTSIALADAFISCWDEKYRSSLIRPETLINQHIDENWKPLLQTPPFPEYTSGHSVISTAAAITLSDMFGENFAFIDSTELEYGLPPREFDSFLDASSEAAISRLYGGIHYMPAINNGVAQGREVGEYVVKNLKTRK